MINNERALNDSRSYLTDYNRRDTLRDVERVFRELDGQGPCPETMSIANLVTAATHCPTPHVIHGAYFRVRIFGNGNLHLQSEERRVGKGGVRTVRSRWWPNASKKKKYLQEHKMA